MSTVACIYHAFAVLRSTLAHFKAYFRSISYGITANTGEPAYRTNPAGRGENMEGFGDAAMDLLMEALMEQQPAGGAAALAAEQGGGSAAAGGAAGAAGRPKGELG